MPVISCGARESTSCQSNIVSATVVATFCGHADGGEAQVLDALILWRGNPGWFQRRDRRQSQGSGGGRAVAGRLTKGQVEAQTTYGEITIAFAADFDEETATIGETTVSLKNINTIVVDGVDRAGARHVAGTSWIEPRLPLGGDVNVAVAQRSPDVLRELQCEIPMPSPPTAVPQVPVITVCEKIRGK